jgi:hypothetical protein
MSSNGTYSSAEELNLLAVRKREDVEIEGRHFLVWELDALELEQLQESVTQVRHETRDGKVDTIVESHTARSELTLVWLALKDVNGRRLYATREEAGRNLSKRILQKFVAVATRLNTFVEGSADPVEEAVAAEGKDSAATDGDSAPSRSRSPSASRRSVTSSQG